MAEYYQESPLYNVDWSGIFSNMPKTNVGMVPIGDVWDYTDPGVPQLGYEENWFQRPGWVDPRDLRAQDLLGYSAYDKIQGVPQLGIPDYLRRKQIEYNRPENLGDFEIDPNAPIPGGTYNTELNPFNPSSKFFPSEIDFSGAMAAKALQKSGDPIYDISRKKDFSDIPPSLRAQAEYINKPVEEGLYGVTTWRGDAPTWLNVGLNVPALERDKGKIDSTVIHEARHYFEAKFGFDTSHLSDKEMHNVIYQFQGMFYNNPIDRGGIPYPLTKREADAFMKIHQEGKEWYQNQGQGFGKTRAEKEEMDKLIRQGAAASMAQAGVDLSGRQIAPQPFNPPQRRRTYQDTAQDRQEQRERERGGANRSFTRTKYGKAYKKGGLVSIDHLTRRL